MAAAIAEIEGELEIPPFPKALGYIWQVYFRLRHRAAPGFAGPSPVTWQDIDAFVRCSGFRLAPWEIELIEALDNLCLGRTRETERKAVPATDGESVKALMGSLSVRKTVIRKKG